MTWLSYEVIPMKNLLIVEDSRTVSNTLLSLLEKYNQFHPIVASNFQDCRGLVESGEEFFCAIADINLRDAPHGETIDFLLAHAIPTIVLTGRMDEKTREIFNAKPIVDYVIKRTVADFVTCVNTAATLNYMWKKKALVVDDSKTARAMIRSIFDAMLFEVHEAENGTDALELLRKYPDIKVATFDYEMPDMNGSELAERVRQNFYNDHLIIFGITSHTEEEIRARFLMSGISDYLTKPLLKEEFSKRLLHHMKLMEQYDNIKGYVDTVDKYVISSIMNEKEILKYTSEALCTIAGYSKTELIGQSHNLLWHPDNAESIKQEMDKTLQKGATWQGEIKLRKKDGSLFWVSAIIDPVRDAENNVTEYRTILQDITDRKKVETISSLDPLTQIYNRLKLDEVFKQEIYRARRYEETLSVIILDIDHFKSVNDTFGHQTGDYVLTEISAILKTHLRESDTLGRWGGEEFLIIVPGTDLQGAMALSEKLRESVQMHHFKTVGQQTGSFGVAQFSEGDTKESLIGRADTAMYVAKNNGRNRVESA